MIDLDKLKNDINQEALRLGFSAVGVAPAHPISHFQAYLNWVSEGYHANMGYLERPDTLEKRKNPQNILENCLRIICLAMPYHPPQASVDQQFAGKGRISAYARTIDYHEVIWEKLAQLEVFIKGQTRQDLTLKSYVDTGPILERSYANLAGLGAAGRNSCLIIPGAGSYYFLGEILTDLALPLDEPFDKDLCRTCRRCIDACPTGAILPNHTIDAHKCISYLTIENKGDIRDGLKKDIGTWVFGCDICQMVCPHNQDTQKQQNPLGEAIIDEFIDLLPLFSLNEDNFNAKYQSTALARTKRTGMLRNAAIVLGNQGCQRALPALRQTFKAETNQIIKDACRWAIEEISSKSGTAHEPNQNV